jgi:hypothetical protein
METIVRQLGPRKGGRGAGRAPKPNTMASHKKHRSPSKGRNKTFAARRTMNPTLDRGSHQASSGDNNAFQQHDRSRRLGGFEGAGNHARTGNRGHK